MYQYRLNPPTGTDSPSMGCGSLPGSFVDCWFIVRMSQSKKIGILGSKTSSIEFIMFYTLGFSISCLVFILRNFLPLNLLPVLIGFSGMETGKTGFSLILVR